MSLMRNPALVDAKVLARVLAYLVQNIAPDIWLLAEPPPAGIHFAWQQVGMICRAMAVYALWLALIAFWMSWSVHAPYWLGTWVLRTTTGRADLDFHEALGAVTTGAMVYQAGVYAIRVAVETFLRRERALSWLTRWMCVLFVLTTSAVIPTYLCGILGNFIVPGIAEDAYVTRIHPHPVLTVLYLGALGVVILWCGLTT
jgi:hypothetical protein